MGKEDIRVLTGAGTDGISDAANFASDEAKQEEGLSGRFPGWLRH